LVVSKAENDCQRRLGALALFPCCQPWRLPPRYPLVWLGRAGSRVDVSGRSGGCRQGPSRKVKGVAKLEQKVEDLRKGFHGEDMDFNPGDDATSAGLTGECEGVRDSLALAGDEPGERCCWRRRVVKKPSECQNRLLDRVPLSSKDGRMLKVTQAMGLAVVGGPATSGCGSFISGELSEIAADIGGPRRRPSRLPEAMHDLP
jgi:hypothetical protein